MSASVDSVTAQLATASLDNTGADNAGAQQNTAENEAVLASAAEGRRLYIGNLAYATTEGELKDFFKDYLVYVAAAPMLPSPSPSALTFASKRVHDHPHQSSHLSPRRLCLRRSLDSIGG